MHEVPDEYLADAMPLAKKIAVASKLKYYNILQVRLSQNVVNLSPRPFYVH